MCHARYDGCCRIIVIRILTLTYMSNFEINVETDGWTNRQTEKGKPVSQSQELREMFHARFDGCLVL